VGEGEESPPRKISCTRPSEGTDTEEDAREAALRSGTGDKSDPRGENPGPCGSTSVVGPVDDLIPRNYEGG